ncbi:MAG TPA: glycosyltransferase family 4 protein [Pyrinomonadaceae bacterium]
MKILQISSAQAFGGGERHLADLSNELVRRGHDVYAVLRPRSPLLSRLTQLAQDHIKIMPLSNALDVKSANSLAGFVKQKQIQIVHAHMARDYSIAAYAARRNQATRLIVTRHVLFKLNRLHRATLARAARVIAVSEAVARELRTQDLLPPSRISVVHNGVDVEALAGALTTREEVRRKLNVNERSLLVGTIGQLNPNKGHEDLVRAMAQIVKSVPLVDLVIAGADPSSNSATATSLKRLSTDLGLENRVRFLGEIENSISLLPAFDVFVSASHTESFGLAMVEAMACGLPLVATSTDGANEVIAENQTGFIVPIGDHEALAASIITLANDAQLRVKMGRSGQLRARECFGLKRMVDAIEEIYSA